MNKIRKNELINLPFDLTERKKNEEKLTFQLNLLASVHDAIIAVDENDKYNLLERDG